MALEVLDGPYILDFLPAGAKAHERNIERELLRHLTEFLLELGSGFPYVAQGNPWRAQEKTIGNIERKL